MQKTTNYELNQWDKTDRIRMEDFNADNAKINAALGRKAEYVVLKDIVTTAASSTIDIDVSSLNLKDYRELYLRIENAEETSLFSMVSVVLRLNGSSSSFVIASFSASSYQPLVIEFTLLPTLYLLGCHFSPYLNSSGVLAIASVSSYTNSGVRTDAVKTLTLAAEDGKLSGGGLFYPGVHVTLTGLKI